jgi:transposase
MHAYPSDITRDQFEIIRSILEYSRKRTRPRVIDLYDIFCGILYLLKSGCQWRMLPKEYPKWRTCHYYFTIWSEKKNENSSSTLDKVLKKISRKKSYFRWPQEENELYNHRCTECKKHRYSEKQRI